MLFKFMLLFASIDTLLTTTSERMRKHRVIEKSSVTTIAHFFKCTMMYIVRHTIRMHRIGHIIHMPKRFTKNSVLFYHKNII